MGHDPSYLHNIFSCFPEELKAALATSVEAVQREEEVNQRHIRQCRAKFNLDLIDSLLGATSQHKEQLACGQCDFNCWESATHAVLAFMWDRRSNERLGCYANPHLARMLNVPASDLLELIAHNALPATCPPLDDVCFKLEEHSSSSSSTSELSSVRYARFCWPGAAPQLMEFVEKRLFDQLGSTSVSVTFMRQVSPEEWDRVASDFPALVRPLASALGDVRSGRQLLDDFDRDMRQDLTTAEMQATLRTLAHEVARRAPARPE